MGVCYAVLSHANAAQVRRLALRLRRDDPSGAVVVHHDPTGPALDEADLRRLGVTFVEPRHRAAWGGFGIVRAYVETLRTAVRLGPFDWIVVLSGQDYPLRPVSAYAELLGPDPGPKVWAFGGVLEAGDEMAARYYSRYVTLPRPLPAEAVPAAIRSRVRRLAKRVDRLAWATVRPDARQLGVRWPTHPFRGGTRCACGSMWMTMSGSAAKRALERWATERHLVRHFRWTFIPDEAALQTLLLNDPEVEVVLDDHHRYICFDGGPHPRLLTASDLPAALASGKWFARKFDESVAGDALDVLDARLDEASARHGTSCRGHRPT